MISGLYIRIAIVVVAASSIIGAYIFLCEVPKEKARRDASSCEKRLDGIVSQKDRLEAQIEKMKTEIDSLKFELSIANAEVCDDKDDDADITVDNLVF